MMKIVSLESLFLWCTCSHEIIVPGMIFFQKVTEKRKQTENLLILHKGIYTPEKPGFS